MADGGLVALSRRDVAAVHDHAADVGIAEQVVHRRLERAPAAAALLEPELHRLHAFDRRLGDRGQHRVVIVGMDAVLKSGAEEVVGAVAEEALHRGALIENVASGIDHRGDVGGVLDERAETALVLAQCLLRLPPRGALARFAQLALDGRDQPRRVALHDVVVRAGLHRLHRHFLADGAGEDDERDVQLFLAYHRQRLQGVEARQRVVGDDQVPRLLVEQAAHLLARLHAEHQRVVAGAVEVADQQLRVVFGVLDQQRAQTARAEHGRPVGVAFEHPVLILHNLETRRRSL